MSTDIAVNDLVYVAKPMPCCGNPKALGEVFTVRALETYHTYCIFCYYDFGPRSIASDSTRGHCVTTLKKFDPKSEPDRIEEIALLVIGELAGMTR